ncbi:Bacteriophytochrome (light-regulated signal transduction histidine kinase) [Sphingomonas laterariae]|uniref:histidine kinase n=1 Tax=Edaphosphingomonas laterariae TaxID=861865 RepID=A0A239I1D0_9SPHN|nr:HWE histidine kinase domain-containing protein [Sphingomonas laterariae]SNS87646.1 Bacteriophytochrome (light-regulated signal transduction histidine kinase) [Sphingomonas laterariae]
MADDNALDFAVDLTNCDREPIHVLGIIQPFGYLVAVTADWIVNRVSANIAELTGAGPHHMLGRPLSDFISADGLHAIRNRLAVMRGPDAVERLFAQKLTADGGAFDVAVHMVSDLFVIEAEPAVEDGLEAAAMVRAMVNRLDQTDNMTAFLREGARQVRAITGFDRVMVYRFDEQLSGEVVAEALRPGTESFLGLHYPASDIPAQARKLYLRNIFRVIADIGATPIALVPQLDTRGVALDQSLSVLRAVSPIHIEYLKNMGVGASLSISIIVGGKLWGLFACHHYSPKLPSFAARTGAELFGQIFSLMLESRERREAADYESRARMTADRLMATIAQDNSLLENAQWLGEVVADAIPADGFGVYLNGAVSLSGLAPNEEQFAAIVGLLNRVAAGQVYATDSLQAVLPEASAYSDIAAGVIAIPVSRSPRDYVVLFRSERLRSVRWAGNPEKQVEYGPNGPRLTPRKSFEAWSELVKGTSNPFTAAERRVAESLRMGMIEVLIRLSENVDKERARANERQELLIAELNHRVRNILSLIRGLISQTRGDALTVEDFIATLDRRIQALARAHDQITADRWGPARLIDLIEIEMGAYAGLRRDHVRLEGVNVLLQPSAFSTLALVIHEMMTNAAKYGALSDSGEVVITWSLDQDGSLLIDWTERGGPAVTAPSRRGFGSTIIERSIPYDLGGLAEINYRLAGVEAHFCVPSRHVAGVAAEAITAAPAGPASVNPQPLKGQCVLLVEDSMIIALDGEDALRDLGADLVITASTVANAKRAIDEHQFDFALLDFNLGAETSAPVAALLAERGIRFAFATGYGEAIDDFGFEGVKTLAKPYGMAQLLRLLSN